jgi:acetylornithine deacetylase/succinyl-diaminopimelate desuccinylase-like protein
VGRGVADNKGHIIQNLTAIRALINENKLRANIVFLFEGEEEVGSVHLSDYLSQVTIADLSAVDAWYITDTGMHDAHTPQIYTGLRGMLYTELSLTTGTRDLHSGVYGNRVYNAANLICEIVGDIKDSVTGRVLIPGFYDDIVYPDEDEYEQLLKIHEEDESVRQESGQFVLPPHSVIPGLSQGLDSGTMPRMTPKGLLPRTLLSKILPSCDVHGIEVGYVGPGAKTVIPREATTKISFRLVPGQVPTKVEQQIRSFLHQIIPEGIKWDLQTLSAEPAFVTDIKSRWATHTTQALNATFRQHTVYNRSGGSIPAAGILQKRYGKAVILTGFTLPDDCIHAPNENFDERMYWKGIEALKLIYSK